MSIRFLARCVMSRRNNGIAQLMFMREVGRGTSQPWLAIINAEVDPTQFTEGENYWIQVSPSLHDEGSKP